MFKVSNRHTLLELFMSEMMKMPSPHFRLIKVLEKWPT
jgi:hypothetical protein